MFSLPACGRDVWPSLAFLSIQGMGKNLVNRWNIAGLEACLLILEWLAGKREWK